MTRSLIAGLILLAGAAAATPLMAQGATQQQQSDQQRQLQRESTEQRRTQSDLNVYERERYNEKMQKKFRDGLEDLRAGDYTAARRKLEEVVDYSPEHPEANYWLAVAYIGADKDYAAAKKRLEVAVAAKKDYVEAEELLAKINAMG